MTADCDIYYADAILKAGSLVIIYYTIFMHSFFFFFHKNKSWGEMLFVISVHCP